MNSTRILYEGDSSIHVMPSTTHPGGEHITAELQAWTRRIDAVWNAFGSIAAWFDRRATDARQRQVERQLGRTTGLAEFERRLRELERGKHFPA